MALSAGRVVEFDGQPEKVSMLLDENDTYYRGGIMVVDGSDGYAKVPSDAAALEGAGILTGRFEGGVTDYAHVVASGAFPRAEMLKGRTWLPVTGSTAAQGDVGDIVYLADDQNLTKSAGSKTIGYRVLDFKTGFLLIDLRQPIKLS